MRHRSTCHGLLAMTPDKSGIGKCILVRLKGVNSKILHSAYAVVGTEIGIYEHMNTDNIPDGVSNMYNLLERGHSLMGEAILSAFANIQAIC